MLVAGVDGCSGGWVLFGFRNFSRVLRLPEQQTEVRYFRDIGAVLDEFLPDPMLLAIDIPIGLIIGPRRCDVEARECLGRSRSSSVFPAPCRQALSGKDYADASRINWELTGRKLSRQTWGILPKIKQVDEAIRDDMRNCFYEVHPEVCFWQMNDMRPMSSNKKSAAGKSERVELLRRSFPDIERNLMSRPRGVEIDDLLDAAAAAWTAARIFQGTSKSVGGEAKDELGLAMNIHI